MKNMQEISKYCLTEQKKNTQNDEENIIENKIYNEMKRETIIASSLFEKVENSI